MTIKTGSTPIPREKKLNFLYYLFGFLRLSREYFSQNISRRFSQKRTLILQINLKPMKRENELSYLIRGAAFKVYNRLGPGLLESVYEKALEYELRNLGLSVESQVGVPMNYNEIRLEVGFRLDLLVEQLVIIEVKSIETLLDVHHKQLLTYLILTGKKLGLLINFNTSSIDKSMVRIVNKL
jgi:GxxExxY protein